MSEERLDTLENALKRLAESEARAWDEIGKLSKSQMEVDTRQDELSANEAKAWEAIGKLAARHDELMKAQADQAKSIGNLDDRYHDLTKVQIDLATAQINLIGRFFDLSKAITEFSVSVAAASKNSSERLDRIEELVERFIRAQSNGRN